MIEMNSFTSLFLISHKISFLPLIFREQFFDSLFHSGMHITLVEKHTCAVIFYPFYDIKGKRHFFEFIAYWHGLKSICRLASDEKLFAISVLA